MFTFAALLILLISLIAGTFNPVLVALAVVFSGDRIPGQRAYPPRV